MSRLQQWVVAAAVALAAPVASAQSVVLDDTFDTLSRWKDLSTAVTWGGLPAGTSAFQVSTGVVRLSSTALANGGYTTASSLKTFTALDHPFATPISHQNSIVTIDFRARWPSVSTSSGEASRLNVTLVHAYPTGGLQLATDDRYDDFTAAWWGRPAYQVRIRGSSTTNGRTILQYGGGLDVQGEWERYNGQWWLPGFNSAPGGGSPGSTGKGWTQTDIGIASANFRFYRYVVYPDRQEIWWDDDGNGIFEPNDLRGTQNLLSDPNNPGWFFYFPTFQGVRLYWRGSGTSGNVELDWLRVTVTPAG